MTVTPATEILGVNILPEPFHVLGQDLLPFSIGHALLMDKLEIRTIATAEDLVAAILICCQTYSEFEAALNRRSFGWKLAWWGRQCRKTLRDPKRLEIALETFRKYMADGTSQPDYDIVDANRAGEINSKTPFLQHLRVVLLSKLNYSPSEIMDTPLSQAMWDFRAYMELEGSIVISDGKPGENTSALFEGAEERIAEALKLHSELHNRGAYGASN